jgi:signal transduction histidine kinase
MTERIPFFRRLGFRVGLVLFLGLFLIDSLMLPFWNWVYYELSPESFDPEFLRGYADYIETLNAEERENLKWEAAKLEGSDQVFAVAATAAYASVFSLLLGSVVAFVATRRITRLTRQAAPVQGQDQDQDQVPGPFQVQGADEIALLARTMNEMREEIHRLLARIEERDLRRRKWVAEVSHDLRTPLTALAVSLDQAQPLLPAGESCGASSSLANLLQVARLDIRRVQDLADDLLDIARLEAGDQLVLEPVPPGELLREAANSLQPLAQQKGVSLEVSLPSGLPELHADGRRLIRVLENLVSNALHHARAQVTLRAGAEEGFLCVGVEDDGTALSEIRSADLFGEMRKRRTREDSSGIGLEVAEKVVSAHSGKISAERLPGGGTRVEFRLPLPEPGGA